MDLPTRARPSFPHRQPLPSGSFPVSYPNPLEGGQNENHNQRKLIKLITWITASSNSMKIWAMPCRATRDKWVMVENSDKKWSTGEGNANYFSLLALRTPWTVWKGKRQKDVTLTDELPRSVGVQYATGEEWRNNSRKNEEMELKQKQHTVVDVMGDRRKVRCYKE